MKRKFQFLILFLYVLTSKGQTLLFVEPSYISKTFVSESIYGFKPIYTPNYMFKPLCCAWTFPQGFFGISIGLKFKNSRSIIKFQYSGAEDISTLAYKTQFYSVKIGSIDYSNYFLESVGTSGGGITLRKIGVIYAYEFLNPHPLFIFKKTFISLDLFVGINSFMGTSRSGNDTVGRDSHKNAWINQYQQLNQFDETIALPVKYSFMKELKPSFGFCLSILKRKNKERFNISAEYILPLKYSPYYTEEHVVFNILNSTNSIVDHHVYTFRGRGGGIYLKFSKKIVLNALWDRDYKSRQRLSMITY